MPGAIEAGNSCRGGIDDFRVEPGPGANFPLELRRIPALGHICDAVLLITRKTGNTLLMCRLKSPLHAIATAIPTRSKQIRGKTSQYMSDDLIF